MNTNTLTPLQSSIIDSNREKIAELKHIKRILGYLKSQGCTVTAEQLYCYLNPDRIPSCSGMWFVSYSVGYRSCQRGCVCHRATVSKRVSDARLRYTDEQRQQIADARKETVRERYGVDYVWQLTEVKQQSIDTRTTKYGYGTYNNRYKAAKTSLHRYGVDNPVKSPEVQSKMQETCLERYGVATPLLLDSAKQRGAVTLMENYGVTHPSQSQEIRSKTMQTVFDRYGVDNPAKNADVQAKISEAARRQHYPEMLRTYQSSVLPGFTIDEYEQGIDTPWICVTCNNKIFARLYNGIAPRCTTCLPYSVSVFEYEVRQYITSVYPGPVEYNRRNLITPKELDIYMPNLGLAIECNGVYRHTTTTGGKTREYHINKTLACRKMGIDLLHITDYDWDMRGSAIRNMLRYRLRTSKRIDLNECSISTTIEHQKIYDFLDLYDLEGQNDYTYAVALLYQDNIIAVMTAYDSYKGEITLSRYTIDSAYHVTGASHILFRQLMMVSNASEAVAYTNNAYTDAGVYVKIGFRLAHTTAPEPYLYNGTTLTPVPYFTFDAAHDVYWGCGYSCWRFKRLNHD